LGGTFSSSRDGILRQRNTDSISRLWSLLDVFLEAKNFPRAETILVTLQPLVKEDGLPLVDDLNKYFRKLAETTSLEQLDDTWRAWPMKYGAHANAKTFAILINKALESNRDPKEYFSRFEETGGKLKDIFACIEVFGVKNLTKLIKEYKYDIALIPNEYRHIVEQIEVTKQEPESEMDESLPPSLEKPADDLKAVDTFGMKAIRRTLLAMGPELNQEFIMNLDQDLSEKLNFLVSGKSSDINFFKIYKSLKPEMQVKFEDALDDFNQERQRQLENNAVIAAQERWRHDYDELKSQGTLSFSKTLNATLWKWSEEMTPLVQEEINVCQKINILENIPKELKSKLKDRTPYAQFFTLLPANKIAAITILELLKLNSTGGVAEGMRITSAVMAVANALELEYRSEQVKKSERAVFKDLKNPNNLKKYAKSLSYFQSDKLSEWKFNWPSEVKAKMGSLLISMLMHVAKVQVEGVDPVTKTKVHGEAPAFYHSYQYQSSVKVGVLKLHKSIASQLSGDRLNGAVQPQLLPMLVKPRPWVAWNNGGYLYSQGFVIRSKDAPEQTAYLKASSDKLDKVYEGLNVLGSTAWTVNERVFSVMSKVWNAGEEFLDIPKLEDTIELPEQPPRTADPSVIFAWKNQVKKVQNAFNNNRSTRCDANYKLEIARAFLGEKMYFPHNLDFRGRAYPLSPNFNHLGNDLSRGLLIFWQGKELGEDGLKWLKVHLSNLFGIDKAPLTERIQYAEENTDKIFKTAEDPLNYREWWMSADKPWQALATIFELSEALKLPDPTKHISHQPVHQDGTCNGLQHYAALGGDVEGARQVNLTPAERPQDVYTFVANLVKDRLEKLALEDDEMAIVLKDKIKRKVVKQTVMTNVYGVTYIGATAQIDKQLADVFPGEETYKYSLYLTKHVFACIRELFEGAHLIQDWLALCAKMISHSVRIDMDTNEVINSGEKPPHMASTIWTTPLNLPIVQPYRSVERRQIATNLQTIYIKDPFAMNPVDARKQVAAFPPNFIHSLDATHMLLSAIACSRAGLDFAAVHDSYWTHACDVDTMNSCLRDEFIKLHEVDLIARLKEEFDERYKGFLRLVNIPRDSDAAVKVMAHRKEISKQLGRRISLGDEIYLERKRQLLLNSDDPSKQERGRNEITTVSLLENVDVDSLIPEKKKRRSTRAEKEGMEIEGDSAWADVETEAKGKHIKVLAPLRLPEIPPKGEFDVQELRKSQYFFS
jgi:DNA-directed RNA polymerase